MFIGPHQWVGDQGEGIYHQLNNWSSKVSTNGHWMLLCSAS